MTTPTLLQVFGSPERYVQGQNAIAQLGSEMKKLGMKGPVVIVSSNTPHKLLSATWEKSLESNGYSSSYVAFSGVCTSQEAEQIAVEAKRANAKTIIAIGGGQVIDAARAGSIIADCEVVTCPTLAFTNAPCSTLCAMYQSDHSFHEFHVTRQHPTLVLVDTTVVANAPKRMLVGGIGDALATWFEARSVKEARKENFLQGRPTDACTALAKLCYNILIEDGPAAVHSVDTNTVTPALERVVEANTLLSGLGFESGGFCVAHSVHNGLTSQPVCANCTHSENVASSSPTQLVLEGRPNEEVWTLPLSPQLVKNANYTHGEKVAFGLITQLVLEGRPEGEVNAGMDLCYKIGLPITLKELGIHRDDEKTIHEIAARALEPEETAHNEPFEVTIDMLTDAIRVADRIGSLFHVEERRKGHLSHMAIVSTPAYPFGSQEHHGKQTYLCK